MPDTFELDGITYPTIPDNDAGASGRVLLTFHQHGGGIEGHAKAGELIRAWVRNAAQTAPVKA
jgi:hypothetical protein